MVAVVPLKVILRNLCKSLDNSKLGRVGSGVPVVPVVFFKKVHAINSRVFFFPYRGNVLERLECLSGV